MKFEEMLLSIKTDFSETLSTLGELYNKFSKVREATTSTANSFKKVGDNITPTTKKLDNLSSSVSKTADTFQNKLYKALNLKPTIDTSGFDKYENKLSQTENETKEKISRMQDYYNQMSEYIKSRGYEFNSTKYTYKPFDSDESVTTSFYELKNYIAKLKSEIDSLNNKKISVDTGNLSKNVEDGRKEINKLGNDANDTGKKLKRAFIGINISGLTNNFKKFENTMSSFGKNGGNTIDNLTKKFKKLGLGLLGVRTAMSMLTKAVGAYMSFDSALQDSISNSWNMLGSLLAPAIEMIANLFATATTYIYSFVKALTGIDLVARANAKALATQAEKTKKAAQAQRSLSSMDEITNLQTEPSGEEASQITVPEIDTSFMDTIADKVKSIAGILFEPIKNAWDKVGGQVISSAKKSLISLQSLMKSVGKSFAEVWTNGTGESIMTNMFLILRNIFDIIGNISDSWRKAWESDNTGTNIVQSLANALNNVLELINKVTKYIADWWKTDDANLFSESVLDIFETISDIVEHVSENLVKLWDNGLSKIVDGVNSLGTGVVALLDPLLKDLEPIVNFVIDLAEKIGEIVSSTIGDILKGIGDALKWIASNEIAVSIIEGLGIAILGAVVALNAWNIAMGLFNVVTGIASVVGGAFGAVVALITSPITLIVIGVGLLIGLIILLVKHFDEVSKVVGDVFNGIGGFFNGLLDGAKGVIQWINDAMEGLAEWIGEKVSGIWDTIKNVFGNVASFFKGIFDNIKNFAKNIGTSVGNTIAGAFKAVVNGVLRAIENILNFPIRAINGLIRVINKVPGINISRLSTFNLPRLATGTNDIPREGIYHLHEGEAVVPKKYNPATGGYNDGSDNKQIIDLLFTLNQTMIEIAEKDNNVYLDGRQLAEGLYDPLRTVTKNKNVSSVVTRS